MLVILRFTTTMFHRRLGSFIYLMRDSYAGGMNVFLQGYGILLRPGFCWRMIVKVA